MKTPKHAGLPSKFQEWRKGQDRALRDLLYSQERFNLLCIPTGGGKTGIVMGYAGVDDGRVCYVTSTRALQDQVMEDFQTMGLVDVRGRSNYICDANPKVTAAQAVCTAGVYCKHIKLGPCGYYDKVREGRDSRLTLTNYSFWLHAEESGSLGEFSTLILDEAHNAHDEVSKFAAVEITEHELRSFKIPIPPWSSVEKKARPSWWATQALQIIQGIALTQTDLDRRVKARDLMKRLARLCRLSEHQWLGSKPARAVFRWDLVDPSELAEELLFRGAKRIILVSASARRKTLQLLGVDKDVKVQEQESTFPVARRPIYYWPIANMKRGMPEWEARNAQEAMDSIIEPRLDRKGFIPSVSYKRAEDIVSRSRFRDRMILHEQGEDAAEVLDRFRAAKPGTILVSPVFGTGTDLAYRSAEYMVIPKVPFPDLSSPLVKARAKLDKTYTAYVTMQTIVQNCGRGMRAKDDQFEVFILDSNFGWLRHGHWDFAPQFFHRAVRTIKGEVPPAPPPSLKQQGIG